MSELPVPPLTLDAEVYARALDARDPRFDGVFFVGITSTRIYCRPVCPARVSYPEHRRFFASAAAAEQAGYRPCLRCRPELAPGRALVDAVPCLARTAALRIAAGALNGRSVGDLARELGVGERQLRRAMERELGVAPCELAQTHRLLLAKCLLTDTALPVTRIAFASGFQSLRRFNSVFRERYRMNPSTLRRRSASPARPGREPRPMAIASASAAAPVAVRRDAAPDLVQLTLSYRAPLAWDALIAVLAHDATPGVELIDGQRYGRTVRLGEATGVVFVEDGEAAVAPRRMTRPHVRVEVSLSLIPVLMPLLARLRQLLDLDAEPLRIDAQLAACGLGELIARRRGVRVPSAFDGFELACRTLVRLATDEETATRLAEALALALGEPLATGVPGLARLAPSAERVASAGAARLAALGVPPGTAEVVAGVARAVANRSLRLEPGSNVDATERALRELGVGAHAIAVLTMRALHWPDGFPASSAMLQRAAGVADAGALIALAEPWRPWRSYAAAHLWLRERCARGCDRGL
jgi:AraC family transcriptional regulator, regulatory protein of adaptative response / DNA-3-methyladenine glycosylase II